MKLAEHPTVVRLQQDTTHACREENQTLDADWLRQFVLDAGADDVGFVELDRPELDDQRDDILRAFHRTKTWLGFLANEKNLVWALLRRKIRLKGSPKLLIAFGKCFPS